MSYTQCKPCFGRGYKVERRRASKRNPWAQGFYARTCRSCGGGGHKETTRPT